jgi:hypothetical protein
MKKRILTASTVMFAAVILLLLPGCLKDTGTQQYKVYTPVYKANSLVRADIVKSNIPQPVVTPGKMYIVGTNIFLVEKEKGIHIIDNSNPAAPVNKAFINIPGNEDIAVKGNILYADCYADLFAIDISNPSAIVLKNYIVNLFPDRRYINGHFIDSGNVIVDWKVTDTQVNLHIQAGQGIWSNGSYITTSNYYGGGVMYNSIASASSSQSGATGTGGSMARMAIVNDRLYTVSDYTLNTLSITNPSAPGYLNNISTHMGMGGTETIYPFQDKLFIGSMSGMYIFSISTPDNPTLLGTFSHATVCDPVITDGTNAYVTLHSGTYCTGVENELDVVNVQDVMHPSLLKKYSLTHPNGLCKDGNTLIVCDDGLKIYDATDPGNLQLKQSIAMTEPYDVICTNGIAIVSAKDGLYQFNYTDPSNVKLLSKMSLNQ